MIFQSRKGFGRGGSLRAVPDKKDAFAEIVSGDPGKRSYKKVAGFPLSIIQPALKTDLTFTIWNPCLPGRRHSNLWPRWPVSISERFAGLAIYERIRI